MSNEITAYFKGRIGLAESVYQYDYGKILVIDGINLPSVFEVHFNTLSEDDSVSAIGQNNRVTIPNSCLEKPGTVTAYIYLHSGDNDGETEYAVKFGVIRRARPDYDEEEKKDWETAVSQALALLQNSRKVNTPLDEINQVNNGIAGQVLRTKGNGATEWVFEGLPTDEQTERVINAWLDDHPEATTTVQDGSISTEKLATDVKARIVDNIAVKNPLFGRGNNASGFVLSNDPDVSAPIAFTDAVMNTQVFRTRRDSTGFTGVFQSVTAFDSNSVTITDDLQEYLKVGMFVCLYDELPTINDNYVAYGSVESWEGNVLTVTEWYDKNGVVASSLSDIVYAVVNPKFKFYNNFSALHLKNINLPSGAQWTREMIGNQTELYADVAGALFGYDTVLRQNDNNADALAFRARATNDASWENVFHLQGSAQRLLSHDSATIIDGNDAYCLPYVSMASAKNVEQGIDVNGGPVLLTHNNNIDLESVLLRFKTSVRFTLVNNAGGAHTISTTNISMRFGGSNHTIKSFSMHPYEVLDIFYPYGSSYVYIFGVDEYVPQDTIDLPSGWYPMATNQASANSFLIPLNKGHRTCNGATLSGAVGVRQNGTTIVAPTDLTNTSVFNPTIVTLGESFAKVNLSLKTATGLSLNSASIVYLQNCTLTFS